MAFVIAGFGIAAVWHLLLFARAYEGLHLITIEQPIFAFGFLSFAIEGLAFVYLFERFRTGKRPVKEGVLFGFLAYAVLMGSVAVIAHAAKHDVGDIVLWFGLEGSFFVMIGAILGGLVGFIYGRET